MPTTVIALEKGVWCVGREPVAVRPGQAVEFASDAEANYFIGALDANDMRRGCTVAEWEAHLAQTAPPAEAEAEAGDAAVDAAAETAAVVEAPKKKRTR